MFHTKNTDHIKDELEVFHTRVTSFRKEFRRGAPFVFTGKPIEAYHQIDGFNHTLEALYPVLHRRQDLPILLP